MSKIKSKVAYFISDDPDDASVAKVNKVLLCSQNIAKFVSWNYFYFILKALSKNKDMKIVKSDWIRECRKINKLVALDQFLIQLPK